MPRSEKSLLQFARYLLVGGFNTVFGYGLFVALNWTFRGLGPHSYMYAWVLTSFIALTIAFLGYKWFVFRTRGNYVVEWIRCVGVYSSSMLTGFISLPIVVTILRRVLAKPEYSSYIGAAIIMAGTAVVSFLGHKNVSFRQAAGTSNPHSQS
jgi:putative flippase GtrA